MDRLSRFRRNKDKNNPASSPSSAADSSSAPTAGSTPSKTGNINTPTSKVKASKSRTPSPAPTPVQQTLAPPAPRTSQRKERRSPFHGLHLRATAGKRAREASPASLPLSPTIGVTNANQKLAASPVVWAKKDEMASVRGGDGDDDGGPRLPHFLTLSEHAIEGKFQDLIWLERNRLAQAQIDPRWARVSTAFKNLDRYQNIQPWENNRVRLNVDPGFVDYINASPVTLAPIEAVAPPVSVSGPTPPHTQSQGLLSSTSSGALVDGEKDAPACDNYIAMQGPKKITSDHVWRMVVEQLRSPAVIVMLTETHEATIEKCHQYFPRLVGEVMEVNEGDEFGDGFRATVTCEAIEETVAGDAIELRRMVVRVLEVQPYESKSRAALDLSNGVGATAEKDADEDIIMKSPVAKAANIPGIDTTSTSPPTSRKKESKVISECTVYHFLYKKWPDFGVPSSENLDSFYTLMRLSRERNTVPANPRIVHCSAGVGRSGTFIALEHLMRALDSGALARWDAEESIAARKQPSKDPHDAAEEGAEEGVGEDLIFDTVNALREQRRNMVQAEPQYLLLYQVLKKLWLEKYAGGEEAEPAAKRHEVDPFVEADGH